MKKSFFASCMITLSVLGSFAVHAGQWQQDAVGKWYQNDDGSYTVNGWQQIDGDFYYFNDKGYMLSGVIAPDGYYIGPDGKLMAQYQPNPALAGTDLAAAGLYGSALQSVGDGLNASKVMEEANRWQGVSEYWKQKTQELIDSGAVSAEAVSGAAAAGSGTNSSSFIASAGSSTVLNENLGNGIMLTGNRIVNKKNSLYDITVEILGASVVSTPADHRGIYGEIALNYKSSGTSRINPTYYPAKILFLNAEGFEIDSRQIIVNDLGAQESGVFRYKPGTVTAKITVN